MGFVAKAVADCIFNFECRKVERIQRTVLCCDLNFDALLGGKPYFSRHLGRGTVQVLLVAVLGVAELHQHPLCQAAVQIK